MNGDGGQEGKCDIMQIGENYGLFFLCPHDVFPDDNKFGIYKNSDDAKHFKDGNLLDYATPSNHITPPIKNVIFWGGIPPKNVYHPPIQHPFFITRQSNRTHH